MDNYKKISFKISEYQKIINETYNKYLINKNIYYNNLYNNQTFLLNERNNIVNEIQKISSKKKKLAYSEKEIKNPILFINHYLKNVDIYVYECKYWKITLEKYNNKYNLIIYKGKFLCNDNSRKRIIKNLSLNDIMFQIRRRIIVKKSQGFDYFYSKNKF